MKRVMFLKFCLISSTFCSIFMKIGIHCWILWLSVTGGWVRKKNSRVCVNLAIFKFYHNISDKLYVLTLSWYCSKSSHYWLVKLHTLIRCLIVSAPEATFWKLVNDWVTYCSKFLATQFQLTCWFLSILMLQISHGSVATCFGCGGGCYMRFVGGLVLFPSVK
jgi:hypothetical protein